MRYARSDKRSAARAGAWLAALVAGALTLSACDGRRETRELMNMPDMHMQASIKPQEENPYAPNGAMMMPVEGTVPTNWEPYTITDAQADALASKLENPLQPTEDVLRVGKKYYGVFCMPCHGEKGDGMGKIVLANAGMPVPPTFHSEKVRDQWTDGRIFHVITRGQGNMPSYRRVEPDKRWAIILYLRSLQRAAAPTQEDLGLVEKFKSENPELFKKEEKK